MSKKLNTSKEQNSKPSTSEKDARLSDLKMRSAKATREIKEYMAQRKAKQSSEK